MDKAPAFTETSPLVLVGCGHMGGALLRGWFQQKHTLCGSDWQQAMYVVEHSEDRRHQIRSEYGVGTTASVESLPLTHPAACVVLAVKPSQMEATCASLRHHPLLQEAAFVSIAAGKTLGFFEQHLGSSRPMARAMPNLPATIGKGVTFCASNSALSPEARMRVQRCFEAVGSCYWTADEEALHALTAVYGSGPAFIFYFMQCMEESAVAMGIDASVVRPALAQLFAGSIALANDSLVPLATLREQVTSPGGTTQAGLEALMDMAYGLRPLIERTLKAADLRSREMARDS